MPTFSEMVAWCAWSKKEDYRIWGDCSPNVVLWMVTATPEFQESYNTAQKHTEKISLFPGLHTTHPLTYAHLGTWYLGLSQNEDHLAQCHKSSCPLEQQQGIVPPGIGVKHILVHPIQDLVPPGKPATAAVAAPHSHNSLGCLHKGSTWQQSLVWHYI
jgi:hypothetical protein